MQYHKLESILSVAKSLFARYGVRKTSLEEVAKLARVAKGTIYNYFGSKDRVYLEVLTREAQEVIEGIKQESIGEKNPVDGLKKFIFSRFQHLKKAVNLLKVERGEEHFPEAKRVKENFFKQELCLLEKILRDGIEKRIFFEAEPKVMAKSILLALKGFEKEYLTGEAIGDVEEALTNFISIILRGILRGERS